MNTQPKLLVPNSGRVDGPAQYVTSDLYHIADRIKEIDPNLRLVLHKGHPQPWVVMEMGKDGVERFVSRYERADASIINHLKYMLKVPLQQRVEALQKEIDEENKRKEQMDPEKFERFAYDMHKAMVDANMISPKWGKSYRPVKHKRKAV